MILASLLLMSAAAADDAGFRPARPAGEVDSAVLHCFAIHNRTGPVTGTAEITVTVNAEGKATAVTTPPGTEEGLAAAAQCAGVMLTYVPAKRDGVAVEDRLVLRVTFPTLPTPRLPIRSAIDYCHAPWTLEDLKEGELDLPVRVGRDGKVHEFLLPGGILPWMSEAARCVAGQLEFYPAVLRTTLVESWTVVPLNFNLTRDPHLDSEVVPPGLRSDEAEILAAYRKCYPAGHTGEARINYRITVSKGGRAYRVELLESSGDPALDEAGICILRNLAFTAARRNLRSVESTLNWPILVRPPG
ncbi:MAG: energy transducer TonB [Steroidobacteraceae bacterium]